MSDQRVDSLAESDLANSSDGLKAFVNEYLKVVTDCESRYTTNTKKCFPDSAKDISGSNTVNFLSSGACNVVVALASGAALCLDSSSMDPIVEKDADGNDVEYTSSGYKAAGAVIMAEIDINGPKPPNIFGRDIFWVYVDSRGEIFDEIWEKDHELHTDASLASGAFGKIVNDGWKMNY